MYFIVKPPRMEGDSGVLFPVEWFDEDPDGDRDARPFLYDQIVIPARSIETAPGAELEAALMARSAELEAQRQATAQPAPDVATMLGHGRVIRNGRTERSRRP